MEFVDQIARLRVACETGSLPSDLGRWLLLEFAKRAEHLERVDLRNDLICEAARRFEGPTKTKARQVRQVLIELHRTRRASVERTLLAQAVEIDPRCPTSVKQLARIIGDTEGAIDVPANGGMVVLK